MGGRGGECVWRWGKRGTIYTYRYTVTTRMTPALRWAAVRAILPFSLIVRGKVTIKIMSINHNLTKREESRSGIEPRSFCLPAQRLIVGHTGSHDR